MLHRGLHCRPPRSSSLFAPAVAPPWPPRPATLPPPPRPLSFSPPSWPQQPRLVHLARCLLSFILASALHLDLAATPPSLLSPNPASTRLVMPRFQLARALSLLFAVPAFAFPLSLHLTSALSFDLALGPASFHVVPSLLRSHFPLLMLCLASLLHRHYCTPPPRVPDPSPPRLLPSSCSPSHLSLSSPCPLLSLSLSPRSPAFFCIFFPLLPVLPSVSCPSPFYFLHSAAPCRLSPLAPCCQPPCFP